MTETQRLFTWAVASFAGFVVVQILNKNLNLELLDDIIRDFSKQPESPECVPTICGDDSCLVKTYCKYHNKKEV